MLEIQDYEVLERFKNRVLDKLGEKVYSIIVYGSVARCIATKDSDIDILVIGKDRKDWEIVSKIAYDIDFENGFRTFTTTIFLTDEEFGYRLKVGDPFLSNVLKEGVVLYDSGFYEKARNMNIFKLRMQRIIRC